MPTQSSDRLAFYPTEGSTFLVEFYYDGELQESELFEDLLEALRHSADQVEELRPMFPDTYALVSMISALYTTEASDERTTESDD